MIAVSLLKMYVRGCHVRFRWGTSVDTIRAGILFEEVGVVVVGDAFCLLLLLKSRSVRGAYHHPAFMATARLLITHF